MNVKIKKTIIAVAAVAAIGGAITYAVYPDGIDVEKVARKDIRADIDVLGTVEADEAITVYAPVSGKIGSIAFKVNDTVKEGDVLACYDLTSLENEYLKASINSEYYEDGYNAAVAENNKNKARAASADASAEALKGQYIAVEENRDRLSIDQNAKSNYIQASMHGIEGALDNMKTNMEIRSAELEAATGLYGELNGKLIEVQAEIATHKELMEKYQAHYDEIEGDTEKEEEAKEYLDMIQKESETVEAAKAQYNALASKVDEALASKESAASSVKSIKNDIVESGDALASLPVDSMSTEQYSLYLELTRQLDMIDREWSKIQEQKTVAEEKIVNDSQIKQYEDSVKLAKVDEDQALNDLNLGKEGVKSSVSGTVIERLVDDGAVVEAGTPLFVIQPESGYKIAVMVSRYDIGAVEVGQTARVTMNGEIYDGTVSAIAPIATNDSSGKPRVKVEIELADTEVRPTIGLEAEVVINSGECKAVLSAPEMAVYTDDAGSYVFVLEKGVLARRDIKTGLRGNGYYQVLEGLNEGDRVVITPVTEDEVGTRFVEN